MLGDLSYTAEDFEPLGLLFPGSQQMICVTSNSPIKNAEDFIEFVQSGADFKWTASNPGSVGHIVTAETLRQLGASGGVFVPFSGTGEVKTTLLSERVDFAILESRDGKTMSEEGTVTMIAVLDERGYVYSPEVPYMSQYGIEGLGDFSAWSYLAIRKDTPEQIKDLLREELTTFIASDTYQDFLDENLYGRFDQEYTPEDIEEWLARSQEAYVRVFDALGIL